MDIVMIAQKVGWLNSFCNWFYELPPEWLSSRYGQFVDAVLDSQRQQLSCDLEQWKLEQG